MGACSTHGDMKNLHKIFVGKSEGKKSLERPRRGNEDKIRRVLK
jgi:hypothetical protein